MEWDLTKRKYMRRSDKQLTPIMPATCELDAWIKLQKKALRKATTQEQKSKIALIISEFEQLREQL